MAQTLSLDERRSIIRARGSRKEALLAILLDLQNAASGHCIDEETATLVAEELGLHPTRVHDALTFYAMLSARPQAARVVEVCASAPCRFAHGPGAAELLERVLGVKPGETTPDGRFAVKAVPCFGACDRAPAVKIGETVYGPLDEASLRALLTVTPCAPRGQADKPCDCAEIHPGPAAPQVDSGSTPGLSSLLGGSGASRGGEVR